MPSESGSSGPSGGLQTNRDVYRFVCDLHRRHSGLARTLEEYLRALWQLGRAERAERELPVARFAELLERAVTAEVPPYDPAWERLDTGERLPGFAGWERAILLQIVDLKQLRDAGAYRDEQRYFGLDAPRGGRWYNFAPMGYLECAAAGSFGASFDDEDSDDDSDDDGDDDQAGTAAAELDDDPPAAPPAAAPLRVMVPGQVAVLGPEGKIIGVAAQGLPPDEVEDLTVISWEDFRSFLYQGQYYE